MRRLLGAWVVVLAVSGCASPDPPVSATSSPPAPAGAATSSPAPRAGSAFPTPRIEHVGDDRYFDSPTGNLRCAVTADYATCDIQDRDWELPPAGDRCQGMSEGDWGLPLSLGPDAVATFSCTTDEPLWGLLDAPAALPYGSGLQRGDLVCISERSGITCRHEPSGHGFTLSRASYRLF